MESQTTKRFAEKRILVTGAGRGIGRAIVKELYRQGAKVYALSKIEENLNSLAKELQTNLIPICVDVSNWKDTEAALENLECMDALINNAGVQELEDFLGITEEKFNNQMNVNVKAVLHVSQIVARKMITDGKPGAIVNISSILGKKGYTTAGAYCTTKAALNMLTNVMAVELGCYKITVNAVTPGMVATDLMKNSIIQTASATNIPVEAVENALIAFMTANSVSGEPFIEMKQVVNAVLFLASGENGQITGTNIHVDGGFLIM